MKELLRISEYRPLGLNVKIHSGYRIYRFVKPNPSLELNIQNQKGYQHHGLLCFFFLRPILLTKGLEVDQGIMKSSQVTTKVVDYVFHKLIAQLYN